MATNAARKTAPIKADVANAPVEFRFEGDDYSIPHTSDWPLDVLESFEDGRIVATVRALLGDEQWKRYKSKPRKASDLAVLFGAIEEAAVGRGN
jgi:hypothetical protein